MGLCSGTPSVFIMAFKLLVVATLVAVASAGFDPAYMMKMMEMMKEHEKEQEMKRMKMSRHCPWKRFCWERTADLLRIGSQTMYKARWMVVPLLWETDTTNCSDVYY